MTTRKVSDEIKEIMGSIDASLIPTIQKKKTATTKLQQLKSMQDECNDSLNKAYHRCLRGNRDLTEILAHMARSIHIDREYFNELYKVQEEQLLGKK